MKKITIPSPCSENWNEMTPTEKGAFCQKCSLEVIDFTQKTPEEIRETLTLNLGQRVCGHVSKVQLELVNTNFHVWENQPVHVFQSKFLYACVLVFGMTLFTGCSPEPLENGDTEIEHVEGGIEIIQGDVDVTDSSANCANQDDVLMGEPMVTDDDILIDGLMEQE